MRGVGTLQRLLGGSSAAAAPRDTWAPVPGVEEELRRLSQEERGRREGGARAGDGGGDSERAKRQRVATPAAASPDSPPIIAVPTTDAGLIRLVSAVVGRADREAIGQALRAAGSKSLALEREPRNPADRYAILVVAAGATAAEGAAATQQHQPQPQLCIYLPRTVAGFLSPLLDSGLLRVERAVVAASAASASASASPSPPAVEVLLADERRQWERPLQPQLQREVDTAIAGCVAAGERSLRPRGGRQGSSGGGDGDAGEEGDASHGGGHAAAFQRMLDDVRRYDAHLLSDDELRLLAAVERLPLAPRRLLLRLLCRRPDPATGAPRWLPLGALKYDDVGDVAEAARGVLAASGSGGGGGEDEDKDALQQQPHQPLLLIWQANDADAWNGVLWSLTLSVLQSAALSVMPRGHPALKSTKEPLVASLAAIARAAIGEGGGGSGGGSHEKLHAAIEAAAAGHVVRIDPRVHAAFRRLQRVYFLDEGLDLGIFMAAERGAVRYPCCSVEQSRGGGGGDGGAAAAAAEAAASRFPAFATRRALLEYERALGEAAAVEACLARDDLAGAAAALRPALEAVQQRGVHKAVVWSAASGGGGGAVEAADAMPNAPPVQPPLHPPPPLFLARFSAAWVYASMATVGVSLLEREKKHRQAVDLLQVLLGGNACPSRRGEWWTRLSTNLEAHLKQPDSALEVAEAALADGWVRHGDRLGLQRRVARLCKPPRRWKRPVWASAVMTDPPERRITARPVESGAAVAGAGAMGVKIRYHPPPPPPEEGDDDAVDPAFLTVEELALRHYATKASGAWRGVHCEGGVWGAFFALFFWDVMFASDVPGVFRSPFQTAPLDLGTDAFFPARKAAIERRLQEVSAADADDLERTIRARWAAHAGTACRTIAWSRWTCNGLVDIARCVGALRLSVVLRLMVEDIGGSSGGMPDLLLYRGGGGGEGGGVAAAAAAAAPTAMMVEVKSQSDRLSDQQRMWLAGLAAGGWDVEVLKVANDVGGA